MGFPFQTFFAVIFWRNRRSELHFQLWKLVELQPWTCQWCCKRCWPCPDDRWVYHVPFISQFFPPEALKMFLMVFIPRCLHPPAHPGAAQAHRTTPPNGLEQQTKELGFPMSAEAACSYPQWDAVWSLLLELEFPPNTPGVPGEHRGSWRTR